MKLFVTGTGTDVGKTWVGTALASAARRRGYRVAALKPIETGCRGGVGPDAVALAEACGRPELATLPGLYRVAPPLAPYAAAQLGAPTPHLEALVAAIRPTVEAGDFVLVEGAGGVLVPLDRERTIADLAATLALPVLLVARDGLGVLSDVLCAAEATLARGLSLEAVVLARHGTDDPSRSSNRAILAERLPCPVLGFDGDGEALLAALLGAH